MKVLKAVIKLIRPEQWLKNAFVFLPVFFSQHLFTTSYLSAVVYTALAFCFIASAIYCLNDIIDVERDRKHPKKCLRPIAAGLISPVAAYCIMVACIVVSMLLGYMSGSNRFAVMGVLLFYLIMNIAYSFKLKQYAIVDVFIIAIGFVLRAFVGGKCCDIVPTHWLLLMTFLLALFLAFAKRRDDVVLYETENILTRNNITRYTLSFLNQVIGLIAAITMVCYIMYTVSPEVIARFHSPYIYFTSIFVLAGIIKYLQLTMVDVKSGNPTKVLMKNRFIQCCVVGWIMSFFLIVYIGEWYG